MTVNKQRLLQLFQHNQLPVGAVVRVDFTVDATEARRAGASVAVHTVRTVGPVLTGVTFTLVYVLLTSVATKPRRAGTRKTVDVIATQTAVTAWI